MHKRTPKTFDEFDELRPMKQFGELSGEKWKMWKMWKEYGKRWWDGVVGRTGENAATGRLLWRNRTFCVVVPGGPNE